MGNSSWLWLTFVNNIRDIVWSVDWNFDFCNFNLSWSVNFVLYRNFFFRDFVKKILEQKFDKYILLFKRNEFYYFFIYRFIGGLGVPFGLQNLIPILFGMKKFNYFFSSFFGFIPGFFIFNTIGSGLNSYVAQSEKFNMLDFILSPAIYSPILMFACLMVISLIIKKKFFDDKN